MNNSSVNMTVKPNCNVRHKFERARVNDRNCQVHSGNSDSVKKYKTKLFYNSHVQPAVVEANLARRPRKTHYQDMSQQVVKGGVFWANYTPKKANVHSGRLKQDDNPYVRHKITIGQESNNASGKNSQGKCETAVTGKYCTSECKKDQVARGSTHLDVEPNLDK